mgnify:CR=1 FL=1
MNTRTITLPSDLVDRLESLAERQGRSVNDVLGEVLGSYVPSSRTNWALAVAEGMEAADIDWIDEPHASTNTRADFERHLHEKWQRTQQDDDNG